MNTYRVDFTQEDLRRNRDVRTRLIRDVRKIAKSAKGGEARPRYLRKRRTDRSIGYWFQMEADVHKDPKAMKVLEPYGFAPAAPPVLPESEWKPL